MKTESKYFGVHQCDNCGKDFLKIQETHKYCCKKCSSLKWYADNKKLKEFPASKVCKQCGNTFIPVKNHASDQLYCSKTCYRQHHQDQKKPESKTITNYCGYCGTEFEYQYNGHFRLYCSQQCRIKSAQKSNIRYISQSTNSIKAKCPRCERIHIVHVDYCGTGMPRFYCNNCLRMNMSVEYTDANHDGRAAFL